MLTTAELRKRVMDNTEMSKTTFYDLLKEAEARGLIAKDGTTDKWERVTHP
jgi:DNA-binding PadR family transcriptional regulator